MSNQGDLPEGWVAKESRTHPGRVYYYNTHTGESVWEKPVAAPSKVRCSHILVKHRDSRRPSSWKEETVTRSKEEALSMIWAFREKLTAQEIEFAELAKTESHCSSASRGGDLGSFGRGEMQKEFEDVAFALTVGELSEPVDTASGIHLILRTG